MEVSILFAHTFHKSQSIANRPDFYAVEEWCLASFVQIVCGRRCIGRRKSDYQVLEREVRANLVYRDFTRVGAGKMPDAKTMGRWGVAVGPEVVKQVHQRLVKLAQVNGLAAGRRMRVDTTVVETSLKLELSRKLPSLHGTPPAP